VWGEGRGPDIAGLSRTGCLILLSLSPLAGEDARAERGRVRGMRDIDGSPSPGSHLTSFDAHHPLPAFAGLHRVCLTTYASLESSNRSTSRNSSMNRSA